MNPKFDASVDMWTFKQCWAAPAKVGPAAIITLQKVREVTKNLEHRAMPGAKGLPILRLRSHHSLSGHQTNEESGLERGGPLVA